MCISLCTMCYTMQHRIVLIISLSSDNHHSSDVDLWRGWGYPGLECTEDESITFPLSWLLQKLPQHWSASSTLPFFICLLLLTCRKRGIPSQPLCTSVLHAKLHWTRRSIFWSMSMNAAILGHLYYIQTDLRPFKLFALFSAQLAQLFI